MKTKSLIIVILLFTALSGFSQKNVFEKFADQKEITQVTITKALLKMFPSMTSSVDMNGIDVNKIINKLEQIDIFISENEDAKKMMRKEITAFFKTDKSYEVLMKIKDEKDNIVFYGQKDNGFVKSLVMFIDDDDECVIIQLLGRFTMHDIQEVVKSDKSKIAKE
jgi:hypothetical protein